MDNIKLKTNTAQRVYDDYFKRVRKSIRILSPDDQDDTLREINSHIYESMQGSPENKSEIDNLLDVLDRLGTPEEYLEPIVADRKAAQAARTFNPKHIFQALVLNLTNGIIYSIIGFLYLFLFTFVAMIGCKIAVPDNTGMFFKDGKFHALGYNAGNTSGMTEVLGYWFIPLHILAAIVLYFLITLLFRLTRRKK